MHFVSYAIKSHDPYLYELEQSMSSNNRYRVWFQSVLGHTLCILHVTGLMPYAPSYNNLRLMMINTESDSKAYWFVLSISLMWLGLYRLEQLVSTNDTKFWLLCVLVPLQCTGTFTSLNKIAKYFQLIVLENKTLNVKPKTLVSLWDYLSMHMWIVENSPYASKVSVLLQAVRFIASWSWRLRQTQTRVELGLRLVSDVLASLLCFHTSL